MEIFLDGYGAMARRIALSKKARDCSGSRKLCDSGQVRRGATAACS